VYRKKEELVKERHQFIKQIGRDQSDHRIKKEGGGGVEGLVLE